MHSPLSQDRSFIGWVDVLRIIACFLVVFSHSCDPFVARFDTDRATFLQGVFSGSMVRSCVPLFVMMTGVLLLPTNLSMRLFIGRRISRIVKPLVFWSIVLPLAYYIYLNFINLKTVNPSIVYEQHSLLSTLRKCYTFIFNFNFDTTPLWYLYMLIGLYFIIPVLSAWIQRATPQDIRTFLTIWFITLWLPYVKMLAPILGYEGNYGNMGLLGVCDWNEFGTFYYTSGFIGYLVLAWYLVKYPLDWSWRKTLWILVPCFFVGYAVTAFGFILTQSHFPGNYAYLEILWYFCGINVFMMTFPVFVIVQKLNARPRRIVHQWASFTFGIYLCHFILVQVFIDLVDGHLAIPALAKIPMIAVLSFLSASMVVWLLNKVPLLRQFVK